MIYRKDEFVQDDTGDEDFPVKQIDRLSEVDGEGSRFIGRAALNMQTPLGLQQIPISFEIEARGIQDAFAKYVECATPKIEEVRQRVQSRLEQLRREQDRRIVTPGEGPSKEGSIINLDDLRT